MKKQIITIVVAVSLISAGIVSAATYIGKNIYTEGTLTVISEARFLGKAEFLNDVFINDGNYLKIPVIITIEPNRKDCSELEHVGRIVIRDFPDGAASPKLFVCTKTEKGFEWNY